MNPINSKKGFNFKFILGKLPKCKTQLSYIGEMNGKIYLLLGLFTVCNLNHKKHSVQ